MRWLRRRWPEKVAGVPLGIGDDAAVVRASRGHDLALTTDLSIEDVHFGLDLHPAKSVGHRALARALSDLAAMGARPRFALLSIGLTRFTSRTWITRFYDGLGAVARRFDLEVIGGDTAVTRRGRVVVDVVAVGEIAHSQALTRAGAKPGDRIYVTGRLGMAAWGLTLLKESARRRKPQGSSSLTAVERAALNSHLSPEPRCESGIYLASRRLASACIDVSDGFARDLARVCESSGCGARVYEDRLPVPGVASGALRRTSSTRLKADDALEFALHGGEDYELIFTVPSSKVHHLPSSIEGVEIHQIGQITPGHRLRLVDRDGRERRLAPAGYDHFQK